MFRLVCFLLFGLVPLAAGGQDGPGNNEEPDYIRYDEPLFDGTPPEESFNKWICGNYRYYDEYSVHRILVSFVVTGQGDVTDVKIVRGVDPDLDAEAVRVISSSPPWTPAKFCGQTVKMMFTFPVVFTHKVITY